VKTNVSRRLTKKQQKDKGFFRERSIVKKERLLFHSFQSTNKKMVGYSNANESRLDRRRFGDVKRCRLDNGRSQPPRIQSNGNRNGSVVARLARTGSVAQVGALCRADQRRRMRVAPAIINGRPTAFFCLFVASTVNSTAKKEKKRAPQIFSPT